MKQLETSDDFKYALAAKNAILLLWVNWSMHARKAEATLSTAIDQLNLQDCSLGLEPFRLDLSEQSESPLYCSAIDLLEELGVERSDDLLNSGAGSMIWMRAGNAVLIVRDGSSISSQQVVDYTTKVFD